MSVLGFRFRGSWEPRIPEGSGLGVLGFRLGGFEVLG